MFGMEMKMELISAATISSANATEADIRKAFANDRGRGEFVILSEMEEFYIQAAGENDEKWIDR